MLRTIQIITPKPPRIPPVLFPEKETKGKSKTQSYNVYVREGKKKSDRYLKANQEPMPRNAAINLGADITDNTTARAFKIKKTTGQPRVPEQDLTPNIFKFRTPKGRTKLEKNTYVEKETYGIDTLGELQGIPFKAMRMRRLI